MTRFLVTILGLWLLAFAPAFGAGAGHVLPLDAQPLHDSLPITNSITMIWLAVTLIVIFCQIATRKMSLVPAGFQNFAEWVVESLYTFLEGLMGAHLTKRTFWFFGSIFFFILVTNYLGLIPGVGTVTYGGTPVLRGGNADINMTAAMAFTFALVLLGDLRERHQRLHRTHFRTKRRQRLPFLGLDAPVHFRRFPRNHLDRYPSCRTLLPSLR
jgi:F-type H+-transporting ATPase subunit a